MTAGLILTTAGADEIEAAYQAGETVKITLCSFGDGGGEPVTADPSATALKGRFGEVPLSTGDAFDGMIGGMAIIPCADYPGQIVREFGLESESGTLIAYGAYPETYLPAQGDSVIKELVVKFVMPLVHAENVTLIVDPNIAIITQEEGDKRYYRRSLRLQEVQDEGTEAQQELRENIGCGTSATKDVVTSPTDTTAGRVLTTGWEGLGLSAEFKMGAVSQFLAYSGASPEVPLNGAGWQAAYTPQRRAQAFIGGDTKFYSRFSTSAGVLDSATPWATHYTTLNKPAATDCDAVSATNGGTFQKNIAVKGNGATISIWPLAADQSSYLLGKDYNGDNTFYVGRGSASYNMSFFNYKGGSGIVLAEDGSVALNLANGKPLTVPGQIKSSGEVQSTSADSFRIAYNGYGVFWRNDGINHYLMLTNQGDPLGNYNALRPLRISLATGEAIMRKLNLEDFGYFDARYYTQSAANAKFITGVRHGTEGSQGTHDSLATSKAPSGCVLTGIKSNYNDGNWEVDTIYFRPEQVQLNGNWINTGYSTALLTTPAHVKSLPRSGLSSLLNLRPCLSEAVADNDGNIIPGTADYVDENGYLWSVASRALAGSIFIGVDDAGIIRQIDADATMLRPDGLSVYGLDALPDGCTIDGDWIFDGGAAIPAPVDYVAEAERLKARLMSRAEAVIAPLQRAVKYSLATDEEKSLLEEWEVYTVLLSRVGTSLAPDIEWPPVPA